MEINEIYGLFKNEFGFVRDKFIIFDRSYKEAWNSKEDHIANPGVYVFWKDAEVWKVGRHLTNSRKRAFEHIRDNTQNGEFQMENLKDDDKVRILLFNVRNRSDKHWVAALEILFEEHLKPLIPSGRTG